MTAAGATGVSEAIDCIAKPVALRIDNLLDAEVARWSQLDPCIAEPLNSLRSFVAGGGKRLRPAFCYWAFVGAGGDPEDQTVVDAGAALELLHSFALIHDDVMDDSPQRRGEDSVHVAFSRSHIEQGWVGESRRFGEGVAILVGDMAFVYADLMMKSAPTTALEIFTELRVELNVGQFLDLSASARSDASLPMAQKIAQYKSGKYTVERPMHLGAALQNRYEELAEPFTAYGLPVGEAFQMRDDILGAFGDEEITGKPVGGDIREGKPTAILALGLQRATGADAETLKRYGASDLNEDEVRAIQDVLINAGVRNDIDKRIDELTQVGLDALVGVKLAGVADQRLEQLAYFVAGREH